MTLVLPTATGGRLYHDQLQEFAVELENLSNDIGFRMSARGWAYTLEGMRLINKDQFDRVETLINSCREKGYLPIDFTAEEEGRKFAGVEVPTTNTIPEYLKRWVDAIGTCENSFVPGWWEGEKYYIQMLVEKIDLKSLFEPICSEYHIPVATSKGWSSMLQRAEYARRFKEAEDQGLECVLLYCGDHDADGLRISKFLFDNLYQLRNITWEDGTEGYDPSDLIIDRFGLNYELIEKFNLTWIDNLITGSGKNLADPGHKNHYMEYVQDYIAKYGIRKCEANAIVKEPNLGRALCSVTIERYLGKDAKERFQKNRDTIDYQFKSLRENLWVDPDGQDRYTLEEAIACYSSKLERLIEDQAFEDGQDANPDE